MKIFFTIAILFLGCVASAQQNSITPQNINTNHKIGFIAQEVEEVIKKTGYVFHGVEAPQNDNDHYSIRYAEFVVPLVKAVQELSAKVEKQQKLIEALKKGNVKTDVKEFDTSDELELFQNNPNPFRKDTEIHMNIPGSIHSAVLFIYDLSGKQIDKRTITDRGQVVAKVEGGHLAAGMYLLHLLPITTPWKQSEWC